MKKIIVALMAVLIIATGCESKEEKTNDSDVKTKETVGKKEVKGSISYKGADITPGKSFNEKSVDEQAEKSELPSCALAGMDHVYRYEDVEITANVKDGKETIYLVYFISENAKTNEGIKIGDTKDDMINTYGDGYTNDVTLYTYLSDNGKIKINFQIEDDIITGIDFTLVME